ncbi:hypothetical protein Scel_87710 [Streptomyces cellostaticus]|nr:hypothetical protein Scel_87710 [Streptomyces cellostaticus]
MSKTRLHTQAPIGTVTRIGWKGCPYGPAKRPLTGCFACRGTLFTTMWHLTLELPMTYFTHHCWSYSPDGSSTLVSPLSEPFRSHPAELP